MKIFRALNSSRLHGYCSERSPPCAKWGKHSAAQRLPSSENHQGFCRVEFCKEEALVHSFWKHLYHCIISVYPSRAAPKLAQYVTALFVCLTSFLSSVPGGFNESILNTFQCTISLFHPKKLSDNPCLFFPLLTAYCCFAISSQTSSPDNVHFLSIKPTKWPSVSHSAAQRLPSSENHQGFCRVEFCKDEALVHSFWKHLYHCIISVYPSRADLTDLTNFKKPEL